MAIKIDQTMTENAYFFFTFKFYLYQYKTSCSVFQLEQASYSKEYERQQIQREYIL